MPLPQLLYAQVIKTVRRRRLVRVSHRVVFGTLAAVEQVLAACGWQINTAFIERINLSMRQHVAALGRRATTLCQHEDGLRQQLALYHIDDNCCVPHTSLWQTLPQPVLINGTGSAKQWRPCTPAMAAGVTDRVWTLREVLISRVPPWPQPHALEETGDNEVRGTARLTCAGKSGERIYSGSLALEKQTLTVLVTPWTRLGTGLGSLSAAWRYTTQHAGRGQFADKAYAGGQFEIFETLSFVRFVLQLPASVQER
jgi:hypothetical protein